MFNRIIKFVLFILSFFPVLALTDDNNFGTNELHNNARYRFSLINFYFGNIAFYFLSYCITDKKFSIFYILKMEACFESQYSEKKIGERVKKFQEEHLSIDSEEDLNTEKEFLLYLNEREEKRIEKSELKVNIYAAIVIGIIPIFLVFFDLKSVLSYNIIEKIVFAFLIYFFINIAFLVFQSMKVSGINLRSFCELKNHDSKSKKIIENYYYDWQNKKKKAEIAVSYVKNLENWMIAELITLCILVCLINFSPILLNSFSDNNTQPKTKSVISLNANDISNPYSESFISLTEIKLQISKKAFSRMSVIANNDECITLITNEFKIYKESITINYYIDNTLIDKNTIKILEE